MRRDDRHCLDNGEWQYKVLQDSKRLDKILSHVSVDISEISLGLKRLTRDLHKQQWV